MGFALLINSTVVLVDPTIMPYQTACLLRQVSLSLHSRPASCISPYSVSRLSSSSFSVSSRSCWPVNQRQKHKAALLILLFNQLWMLHTHTHTHRRAHTLPYRGTTKNNKQQSTSHFSNEQVFHTLPRGRQRSMMPCGLDFQDFHLNFRFMTSFSLLGAQNFASSLITFLISQRVSSRLSLALLLCINLCVFVAHPRDCSSRDTFGSLHFLD